MEDHDRKVLQMNEFLVEEIKKRDQPTFTNDQEKIAYNQMDERSKQEYKRKVLI
jgi:hypothetical protein